MIEKSGVWSFIGVLLVSTLCASAAVHTAAAKSDFRYAVIDIGIISLVGDEVAPHLNESGVISWWQQATDQAVHAFAGPALSFRDLGKLPGFLSSIASNANDKGQVVGWSVSTANLVDSSATTHAFLFAGSQMVDLGTLGGRDSKAMDVNESGEVVGLSSLADNITHAFLYRSGGMHDLGSLPGGNFSAAYAINNNALIVGAAETPAHLVHAVVWKDHHIADLGTLPGGLRSRALAVNDRADAVGYSEADGAETHAFLYAGGRMRDLGSLGYEPVRANAINNHRQVVGSSGVTRFAHHAFIWQDGVMRDLNTLISPDGTWSLQSAYDLTDEGQILCLATRPRESRIPHLVLLKPSRPAAVARTH